jgi:hypothetical protein
MTRSVGFRIVFPGEAVPYIGFLILVLLERL